MKRSIVSQASTRIRRATFGALVVGYTMGYTNAGADHRAVFFIVAAFGRVIVTLSPARDTRSS
ncbi:MAG: hypothetical protein GXP48_00590 [Acidobacteria bacterium]|nr:hypothetical protein [Acidobacteriota bacterium]